MSNSSSTSTLAEDTRRRPPLAIVGYHKPTVTCLAYEAARYAKFCIQPLERGFGITLGNSLRRVLLAFVPGAAITSVRIEGVSHEFSTMSGIHEDAMEITLNLKEVAVQVDEQIYPDEEEEISITLEASGKGRVLAADIKCPTGVTVVNPELHLATLTEDSASLSMQMTVKRGKGYAPVDSTPQAEPRPIGVIPIDAIFTPTKKVSFVVEPTRLGHRTDLARLILEVWTNGTVAPEQAVQAAATWLDAYLRSLFDLPTQVEEKLAEAPAE